MSWLIFLGELGLIAYLTMRAYGDGMSSLPFMLSDFYLSFFCSRCHGGAVCGESSME